MASLTARPLQAFKTAGVASSRSRTALRVVARKTAAKTSTAYICIDCGYIYDGKEAFDKLPNSYRCPVCNAPKRRFRATEAKSRNNDAKAMRSRMDAMQRGEDDGKFDENDKSFFITAAVGGAALLGALYVFLSSQTQL
uniref:Rubredoxin-like domain-containing protein n=1 Tax=Tetradesmus obliquus TaxID=3088 RepID=A0A383WB62_TETOB|eukprot:jgi/Sobl393_1/6655/SZX74450.1